MAIKLIFLLLFLLFAVFLHNSIPMYLSADDISYFLHAICRHGMLGYYCYGTAEFKTAILSYS